MEYTISATISVGIVLLVDRISGIRLSARRSFWVFLAVMYGFMIPINGYLTSRPIEYSISRLGIPMRWKTLISGYAPPHRFAHVQLKGPYAIWEHTQAFREVEGGTEMHDVVRYALPLGLLGRIVHSLGIRRQVEKIFEHRAGVLEQSFALHEQADAS